MRKAPSARLWSRFASSWKRLFSEPAATRQSRPRKISIQFDALEDRAIPAIGLFNTGVGGSVIQPPTPYATGVDTSGQSLSYLSSDSHYSISNAPTGYAGAVKVLTSAGAFPVGPWVGDNSTSAWLIPAAADDDGNAAPGDYDYTTTFQVTDPSTAFLSGQWAADDHASIFLNGNDTGISITGFQNFANFQIASGFVTGTNTLTFKVQNGGSSDNPTGLRVQFATPSIAADPHYTLISAPSGYTGSVTKVMPNDAYPIGPWIANNSTSAWISPASTDSQANAPVGDYVYRTTFSLDSFDTNTVLRGIWSADNQGVDILLNGVSTGISHFGNSTPSGIVGYTWTSPFTLTQGFVTGLNTLDFVIRNDALATNDPTFNPTGLRVDGLTIGIADQVSNVGDTVSLSVAASFNAGTTSFLASGLPSGLTIDTNTGVISGTIPVALSNGGYFNVTISASGSASQSFHWTVDSYPAYVAVVNQANTLYASTVQTAVAARNAAQVAAQQNANSAAQGIYDTYLTALDAAKSQLAAALDSALAAYQSALQGPDATLQAAVASATATSNSAMTAAQATYDSAIVAAEGIRQTALTDADNAYTQAVAPYAGCGALSGGLR
ncbi:MAG: Ig domain-containing protein [Gemmataceae bacterium]|nr:Ig domain-containing protein [Gemmataceae bacterium]